MVEYSARQAALLHRRRQLLPDLQRDIGVLLGRRPQLQIQPPARLLVQRAPGRIGVQQESVQHHVVLEAPPLDAHAIQLEQRRFHIASDFRRARVLQPRSQVRQVRARYGPRLAGLPGQPDGIQGELALGRFRDRHGHRRALRHSRQPCPQILGAGNHGVIPRARILARPQLSEQAMKLQLFVNGLQPRGIERPRFHRIERKLHRHVGRDSGQPVAHADALDVVLEALAVNLPFHLGRALDQRVERAEALDQVARALFADSRRSRYVVDGIPLECQQVGDPLRPHAHKRLDFFRVVPFVVLGGVQHGNPFGDELHHVFVARDDHHFEARLLSAPRQRADYIVGFEAWVFEDRDIHGFEHPPHIRNLFGQVGRRFGAVGFVFGELLHPVSRLAALEYRRDIGWVVLLGELPQHVVENVNGLRRKPGARAHGGRAAACARVVGAKDEAERVDQEKPLLGHCPSYPFPAADGAFGPQSFPQVLRICHSPNE